MGSGRHEATSLSDRRLSAVCPKGKNSRDKRKIKISPYLVNTDKSPFCPNCTKHIRVMLSPAACGAKRGQASGARPGSPSEGPVGRRFTKASSYRQEAKAHGSCITANDPAGSEAEIELHSQAEQHSFAWKIRKN